MISLDDIRKKKPRCVVFYFSPVNNKRWVDLEFANDEGETFDAEEICLSPEDIEILETEFQVYRRVVS